MYLDADFRRCTVGWDGDLKAEEGLAKRGSIRFGVGIEGQAGEMQTSAGLGGDADFAAEQHDLGARANG